MDIDFENPPLDDASLVAITGTNGCRKDNAFGCDLCRTLREDTPLRWRNGKSAHQEILSVMAKKRDLLKCILLRTIPVIWRFGLPRKEAHRWCSCVMQTVTN